MTLLPILRRIQRPTTQGHSSHAKYNCGAIRTKENVKKLRQDARRGREYTTRRGKKIEPRETPSPNVTIQN